MERIAGVLNQVMEDDSIDNVRRQAVSVVIPAYNEESAIREVLLHLHAVLSAVKRGDSYEIVVVDDCSRDGTARVVEDLSREHRAIRLVRHKRNRGYGGALKTGARHARGDIVVFFDADGQHDPNDIPRLLALLGENDMVVGQRMNQSEVTFWRMPGKKILSLAANFLTRTKIPDLNSGLRAIKRDLFLRWTHLMPNGFSCSSTATVVALKQGYSVAYVPIEVRRRQGHSTVNPLRDGYNTLMFITRLIALFDPLRVFMPSALALFFGGIIYGSVVALTHGRGFPVAGLLLVLTGIILFFIGIVCDQVSSMRLDRYNGGSEETDF